jgi:membrane fusion protein, multidrug efflux system
MRKYILGLLLVGIIAASCGSSKKEKDGALNDKKIELEKIKKEQTELAIKAQKLEKEIAELDPAAAQNTAKLVSVTPVGSGDFAHYIDLQGRIDATNISYVAPPNGQGGVVTALYVTQGQSVRKGQVLAKLDDIMIRQQMEPLKVQLATAEDTYRRTKNLWDQGIGAYQNVLNAKTQVEALQKQMGIIQSQVSLMTVKAPASGVIDQLNLRVGEFFTGMAGQGVPQIRIVNTGDLKVVTAVPENYIEQVNVGSQLKVILPEQNNREITATVSVVQKIIDPTTRSFNIEAKIPTDANLKPNQIAQVRINDYAAKNAVTVPLNVVQTDEKGKYVYVMERSGLKTLARKKTVIVGQAYGENIEIRSGLNAGEQLVTEGYQNLYDGQMITTSVK